MRVDGNLSYKSVEDLKIGDIILNNGELYCLREVWKCTNGSITLYLALHEGTISIRHTLKVEPLSKITTYTPAPQYVYFIASSPDFVIHEFVKSRMAYHSFERLLAGEKIPNWFLTRKEAEEEIQSRINSIIEEYKNKKVTFIPW